HALGEKTHAGAGAKREVDRVGDHRLLQPRVAAEPGRFNVEVVLRPDALLLADVDRRERKGSGGGLADADQVGRGGGTGGSGREDDAREQSANWSPGIGHWGLLNCRMNSSSNIAR